MEKNPTMPAPTTDLCNSHDYDVCSSVDPLPIIFIRLNLANFLVFIINKCNSTNNGLTIQL